MKDEYTDSEGRKCDIYTMCRREPHWAACRINILEARELNARNEMSQILIKEIGPIVGEGDLETANRAAQIIIELRGDVDALA